MDMGLFTVRTEGYIFGLLPAAALLHGVIEVVHALQLNKCDDSESFARLVQRSLVAVSDAGWQRRPPDVPLLLLSLSHAGWLCAGVPLKPMLAKICEGIADGLKQLAGQVRPYSVVKCRS